MDPQNVPFERYECLEGTWTPMMAMGEDHFFGTVRHTVYTPRPFGTTTQTLKARHFAFPRAPYTYGPSEFVEVSSDTAESVPEPEPAPEPEQELDDVEGDPDYVPSDHSASSMSEDDSDDSGYTLSSELPPPPEYNPGPMEDDPEYPDAVHADGADPLAAIYTDAYSVFYVLRIPFLVTRLISIVFKTINFIANKNRSFGTIA